MFNEIPESERCHPPSAMSSLEESTSTESRLSAFALPFAFVLRRGFLINGARRCFWWNGAGKANGTSLSDVSSNIV
jgi:hypothetical protein